MSIDFTRIITYRGSQRDAFEELVCQAVRRTETANNDSWVRLDGSGGDGGVEAYWYEKPDVKIGVQAKFFTRSRDISWSQIRSSFDTALRVHSDLREYRIYLACDLAGVTGRSGRAGVDRWNDSRGRMMAKAHNSGRDIKIQLISASDLFSILLDPKCVGLSGYWFKTIEISTDQLRQWLDSAVAALGERYCPEDHVEISSQDVIRALSRDRRPRDALLESVRGLLNCDRIGLPKAWSHDAAKAQSILAINAEIDAFTTLETENLTDPSKPWPVATWRAKCKSLDSPMQSLIEATFSSSSKDEKDNDGIRYLREKCHSVLSALNSVAAILRSKALAAEESRAAIITGPAGSGKSHLLAAAAEETIDTGGICLLILGHRFRDGEPWPQVAAQLGCIGVNKLELLGALDAAAHAKRRRCVLMVDALNEGPLRRLWLRELESFANDVLAFKNLAFVASCRDVFEPFVIGPQVKRRFPHVEIRGFETDDEQEAAARVYLDRRGITRPCVPWIAPEFVNPLFLRSCTEALKSAGETEFPTGLIGTKKLLAFYIDATTSNLGTEWDGGSDLSSPCKKALLSVARTMADQKQDWIDSDQAVKLIKNEFVSFAPPDDQNWLTVLLRNGVLREDPHPHGFTDDDPLGKKADVVRFAFQRFQDHLMAETLLKDVINAEAAFRDDGNLAFTLGKSGHPSWDWHGLTEALSIQIPERFGVELVDALPGGADKRWGDHWIESAFVESIKWREPSAISDRTLALANRFQSGSFDIMTLLIELAHRSDHPWNAEFLDANLKRRKLPDRDQMWTRYLSNEGLYEESPIPRLIDWCETAPKDRADIGVLKLCAITLCWFLASTASEIRDRATKALASLFVDRPELFKDMVRRFSDVDDLYVVERLLAAGYGSLARFPSKEKAHTFASAIWEAFLDRGNVPENLLLRDYLGGVIDIADALGALPASIDSSKTRPPYGSKRPVLNATEEAVEKIAERAGGKQIFHSCGVWGDFHRYTVESRINDIARVPLSSPAPFTNRQLATRFENEIFDDDLKRATLEELRQLIWDATSMRVLRNDDESFGFSIELGEDYSDPEWVKRFESKQREFLELLSEGQCERYSSDWLPERFPGLTGRALKEVETIDVMAASRWIARRAYGLGWTEERFGEDTGMYMDYPRARPKVERIGKKYQWLARSELLARLVEYYWLSDNWSDGPKRYEFATDLAFVRDVDPTIFDSPRCLIGEQFGASLGLRPCPIEIRHADGPERLEWPFNGESVAIAATYLSTNDSKGDRWVRLAWRSSSRRYTEFHKKSLGHNLAQQEFFYIYTVLCKKGDGKSILESLQKSGHVDIDDWSPVDYTDGPFLYEMRRRDTWPNKKWRIVARLKPNSIKVAFPVEEYHWESHLDASMTDGARATVLARWLMEDADLELHPSTHQIIRDDAKRCVAWSSAERGGDSGIIVRQDWFENYLQSSDLDCVWVITGEREAWNDGDQAGAAAYRRFNCLKLYSNGAWSTVTWNEDHPAALGH